MDEDKRRVLEETKSSAKTDHIDRYLQDVANTSKVDEADQEAREKQGSKGKVDLVVLEEKLVELFPVLLIGKGNPGYHKDEHVVHHYDERVDPLHGAGDHDADVGNEDACLCVLHETNGSGKLDIAQNHVEEG